jgi:hypothetical protein
MAGLISLGLSLLAGCDTSHEADTFAAGDSRLSIVIQIEAIAGTRRAYTDNTAMRQPMQTVEPLAISSLQIAVTGPELPFPVVAIVTQIMGPEVIVELVVPQGPERHIKVDVFNDFTAMIYHGVTSVDLFLPVHDVALSLVPVLSVNPILEVQVDATSGGTFNTDSEAAGLEDLAVNIPPGAFASDTLLTMGTRNHPNLLPPLPTGATPIGAVLGFESGGVSLLEPLWLTLPYDPTQLVQLGVRENALQFYSLANGAPLWTAAAPISIDPNTATLTVPLHALGSAVIGVMDPP